MQIAIRDRNVPSTATMRTILDAMDAASLLSDLAYGVTFRVGEMDYPDSITASPG